MKKNLQVILTVLLIGFGFGGISLASNEIGNNCIQEDLWDVTTATICVNGTGWNGIEVTCDDIWCGQGYCYGDKDRSHCPDDLYDDSETTKTIQITFSLEGMLTPYIFRGKFDFQNGMWLKDDSESNSYNYYVNSGYIDISAETSLGAGEPTDLIIKTNKDYIGDIFIKKYEMNSNGIGWRDLNDSVGRKYTMKPSDNGMKILSNFIKFSSVGTYKVEVTNSENQEDSLTFTVHKTYTYIDVEKDTVSEEQKYNDEDYNNEGYYDEEIEEENEEDTTDSLTQPVDKSRYEEGNQEIILSNGYSRELNNAYKFAYVNGITTMQDIKLANMDGNLNRISMAKMLSQYAMNVLKKTPDTSKRCSFSDVTMQIDSDYNNGVTLACQLGIMGVGIDNFRPYDEVTRAEFGTALSRMLFGLADGAPYYSTHLAKLKEEKIIDNDSQNLKELRGYVMLMLMRSAMVIH